MHWNFFATCPFLTDNIAGGYKKLIISKKVNKLEY